MLKADAVPPCEFDTHDNIMIFIKSSFTVLKENKIKNYGMLSPRSSEGSLFFIETKNIPKKTQINFVLSKSSPT